MKIPFLFGIHCHQPAENFYNVVDWAINESYAPFIEVALKNKKFKFSAHYSGWLLEYIRNHREDVFNNLKKISDEGRRNISLTVMAKKTIAWFLVKTVLLFGHVFMSWKQTGLFSATVMA